MGESKKSKKAKTKPEKSNALNLFKELYSSKDWICERVEIVNNAHLDNSYPFSEKPASDDTPVDSVIHLHVSFHEEDDNLCVFCKKRCPKINKSKELKIWRHADQNTLFTYVLCDVYDLECPEHGVHTQYIPWAAHNSKTTHAFDSNVTPAKKPSKSIALISYFFRVVAAIVQDWIDDIAYNLRPSTIQRKKRMKNAKKRKRNSDASIRKINVQQNT